MLNVSKEKYVGMYNLKIFNLHTYKYRI